jgi:D-alanyl-D-alanine carboxypeptidase/D-alanyl-D-alanine-endopeptidase (penicillin-binding protein 4)
MLRGSALCLSLGCFGAVVQPAVADSTAATRQEVRRAIRKLSSAGVAVGFYAADLASGGVIYEYRADRQLVPASNVKVAVTAAALDILGPRFEFETTLALLGDDLLVVGGGDPATGDPRICTARGEDIVAVFARWAAALKARGFVRGRGDLLIDDGVLDSERVHEGWPDQEHARWYRAPVGGLNFNDNCVEVEVWPGTQVGSPAGFRLIPDVPHFQVKNKCVTGNSNRPVVWRAPDEDRLVLSGRCSRRGRLQAAAVFDPGMLFGWACKSELARQGVEIAGTVRRVRARRKDGALPSEATVVAVERTGLPTVINRCNKRSQNLFAECLLKKLGLKMKGRGSWPAGCAAVEDFLKRIGVPENGYTISDGSGLSRDNRLSARALARVLSWARRHRHGDVFMDSLPIAGIDGSLRKRFNDAAVRGKVRAKTGSLSGVKALSGYVDSPQGQVVFSMLTNDVGKHGGLVRDAQERICRALVGAGSSSRTGGP